jgi:hypothetical protein
VCTLGGIKTKMEREKRKAKNKKVEDRERGRKGETDGCERLPSF